MNFDERLKSYYASLPIAGEELKEAMLYSLFGGGKRVRPMLFFTVLEDLGYIGAADFYFAAAMESIHTYSLIHDDLPAMDDDDFRRGRPSNHRQFSEAIAILAGDGLLNQAAELAAEGASIEPRGGLLAMRYLFRAAGTTGMVDGQILDIRIGASSGDELIYRKKTGALLGACFAMAGALAEREEAFCDRLFHVGETLGLSYQFQDDLFDLEEDGVEADRSYFTEKAERYTADCLETLRTLGAFARTEALIEKILNRKR
ncbi:Farnesyl diphosphate synthase [Aedoeadaptatus ivorii]|uniref:Farnesyl diphosphate synthase n=1 Tax=Aedoeadaptatus ivorii TaxID=54006 RepID=A0A448V1B5_9FIRM|nr:polyprenyl synthetase family protein [Peptoniphilus ivorii]MDQ0507751.1 geranylgeranyl pyrophosphate synthase [Peptoniphilus ivorii]VEJ35539.1 Farnesyl diphosphate synthase [Peptoniphilus ivorii]